MTVQINFADMESSDALTEHVTQALEKSLRKSLADRLTRIEVHLRDDKKKRRGAADSRCTMEARIAGEKPLAVDARADDLYQAITDAAGKLARAVEHKIERRP